MTGYITADNIGLAREELPADQAAEIALGCKTWPITYDDGQSGRITLWPATARAAVYRGGNSDWGDYRYDDHGQLRITLDAGGVVGSTGLEVDE